jgi:hypothetical protein
LNLDLLLPFRPSVTFFAHLCQLATPALVLPDAGLDQAEADDVDRVLGHRSPPDAWKCGKKTEELIEAREVAWHGMVVEPALDHRP